MQVDSAFITSFTAVRVTPSNRKSPAGNGTKTERQPGISAANVAALFVILFVYGWNQYLWPLLVATDPKLDTIVIGIVKMIGADMSVEWNRVMAAAVLAMLPPVTVVVLMQHWFVKGLTEGDK